MSHVIYKKGEYGGSLDLTLTDSAGSAIDLTSANNIWLYIYENRVGGTTLFSGSCTITTATSGQCYYSLSDGDLSASGVYAARVDISSDGQLCRPENMTLIIEP